MSDNWVRGKARRSSRSSPSGTADLLFFLLGETMVDRKDKPGKSELDQLPVTAEWRQCPRTAAWADLWRHIFLDLFPSRGSQLVSPMAEEEDDDEREASAD